MTRSRRFAVLSGLLLLLFENLTTTAHAVNLADLSGWDIVTGSEPIESETYAAQELQHFLAEATGCELPLRRSAEGDQHHRLRRHSSSVLRDTCTDDDSNAFVRSWRPVCPAHARYDQGQCRAVSRGVAGGAGRAGFDRTGS